MFLKKQQLLMGFPASVKEVVLSGLTKTKRLFQRFNKEDNKKVEQVLKN